VSFLFNLRSGGLSVFTWFLLLGLLLCLNASMANAFQTPAWFSWRRSKNSQTQSTYKDVPLIEATRAGDLKQVKRLLAKGVLLSVRDADAYTALHIASLQGNLGIVEALLDQGEAVDVTNNYGRTPLINASQYGHVDIVKTLVAHGANVNAVDRYLFDDTPLLYACKNGHFEIAKIVLHHGAKVNVVERERRMTPLHFASAFGHLNIVYVLLLNGADINAIDKDGKTPLAWAIDRQQTAVVKLLKRSGAKL